MQIAGLRGLVGRTKVLALRSPLPENNSWSLLLAALFLVLAQILKESARLAEDNASIV